MSFCVNWCTEDDIILIDFVKKHEGIYNVKSRDYRKSHVKQNWWKEVGDILDKTDIECFKRWCYIRDYYIRRKGKPGISGEAASKRAAHLTFLDNLPKSRYSITDEDKNLSDSILYNVSVEYTNSEQIHSTVNEEMDDSGKETRKSDKSSKPSKSLPSTKISLTNFQCENLADSSISDVNIEYDSEHESNLGDISIVKVEEIHDSEDENTQDSTMTKNDSRIDSKRINNAHTQASLNLANCIPNEFDENDLFLGSMAKIVKKLPRYEQAQLRMQIGSLIGSAELRHISDK